LKKVPIAALDSFFYQCRNFFLYFFSKEFEKFKNGYNFATPKSETSGFHGCVEMLFGGVPEWPNGADCKSAGVCLRWFESIRPHSLCQSYSCLIPVKKGKNKCGSSSAGRAIAFQAIGREFEPRLPLIFKTP
jgi:hypothetical protein